MSSHPFFTTSTWSQPSIQPEKILPNFVLKSLIENINNSVLEVEYCNLNGSRAICTFQDLDNIASHYNGTCHNLWLWHCSAAISPTFQLLSVSSQQRQIALHHSVLLSQQEEQFSWVPCAVAVSRQLGVTFQPLSGDQRWRGNISRGGSTALYAKPLGLCLIKAIVMETLLENVIYQIVLK